MSELISFSVRVHMKDFHSITEVTEVLEKYGTEGMQIKIDKNEIVETVGHGSMTQIELLALRLHQLKCYLTCDVCMHLGM